MFVRESKRKNPLQASLRWILDLLTLGIIIPYKFTFCGYFLYFCLFFLIFIIYSSNDRCSCKHYKAHTCNNSTCF